MRQQHHETGEEIPLRFSGADELIDDRLRDVDEVSELRLPKNQRLGIVAAVSVFEPENASLGKRRVIDFAASLISGDVFQRNVFVFILNVDQHRVALVESPTAGVLS